MEKEKEKPNKRLILAPGQWKVIGEGHRKYRIENVGNDIVELRVTVAGIF